MPVETDRTPVTEPFRSNHRNRAAQHPVRSCDETAFRREAQRMFLAAGGGSSQSARRRRDVDQPGAVSRPPRVETMPCSSLSQAASDGGRLLIEDLPTVHELICMWCRRNAPSALCRPDAVPLTMTDGVKVARHKPSRSIFRTTSDRWAALDHPNRRRQSDRRWPHCLAISRSRCPVSLFPLPSMREACLAKSARATHDTSSGAKLNLGAASDARKSSSNAAAASCAARQATSISDSRRIERSRIEREPGRAMRPGRSVYPRPG